MINTVMIEYKDLEKVINSYKKVDKSFPYGNDIAVYSYQNEMFALIYKDLSPKQISLRCDYLLAKHLKDEYETVLGGKDLNPNKWITVICTGQLRIDEIRDLIRHSLEIVKAI